MQKFWFAIGVAVTVNVIMNGAAWYWVAICVAIDAMNLIDAIKED